MRDCQYGHRPIASSQNSFKIPWKLFINIHVNHFYFGHAPTHGTVAIWKSCMISCLSPDTDIFYLVLMLLGIFVSTFLPAWCLKTFSKGGQQTVPVENQLHLNLFMTFPDTIQLERFNRNRLWTINFLQWKASNIQHSASMVTDNNKEHFFFWNCQSSFKDP